VTLCLVALACAKIPRIPFQAALAQHKARSTGSTGNFAIAYVYDGTGCSGSPIGFVATPAACDETSDDRKCLSESSSEGSISVKTECANSVPATPAGAVSITGYESGDCSGSPVFAIAFDSGRCFGDAGTSYRLSCSGSTLTYSTWATNGDCSGSPSESESGSSGSSCVEDSGFSALVSGCSSSKCFHEATVITYNDEHLTLPALLAGRVPECVVPHVVSSDGVAVHTSCSAQALRLTPDHLVYSARGLLAASELRVNDIVFSDVNEQVSCNVTSTDAEAHQRYFGLNCENSVVLANGIKTSAFGVYHTVPTLWMKIASSLVGVKRASAWGDAIAAFLYDWSLI